MLKIVLAAAVVAAAPSMAFAGGTATPAKAAPAAVVIHNFHFMPQTLTVVAGTTVTWTNTDPDIHTVTDRGHAFHSAALDTRDTFSYTFKTLGAFTYFCTFHPMMVGRIIVKPAGSSS